MRDHKCKTSNCKHTNVIYCSKCGATYCKDCGKEWGEKEYVYSPYYYSIPSVWTYPPQPQVPYTITWASTDTNTSGTYIATTL
jgi:hypothetical protein